jgi:two-component system sensor histidine kinase UhpB
MITMAKDTKSYSILVIEDNPGDYALIEDYLEERIDAPQIERAKNFEEAKILLLNKQNFYDTIFLDLSLPDKEGQSLIAEIVSLSPGCPIIVLTGFANFEFSIKSLALGVSDYLLKEDINSTSLYKSLLYNIERKKSATALKESENRYSNLFHLSPQPMWVVDTHTLKFVQVNKAALDLYGFSEDEFLNLTVADMRGENDNSEMKESIIKKMDQGGKFHGSFTHYKKSNEQIEVEIFSSPVMLNDKESRSVIAIDVTEKLLLQQELLDQKIQEQQKIARAVVSAQEKERAGIGEELHDNINQLLAAAKLYLKSTICQPENTEEYLLKSEEYITNAMAEIRKLSHALVGFSPDKVIGIIDCIDELIKDITRVKNIEINFIHPNIHEEDTRDELKLVIFRIIQEQLNNILKHANASKVDIELKVYGNDLIVSVKDNGKGFDTFAKREGVGLKNIKNRAELYNGKVDLASSAGNGCAISICFKDSVILKTSLNNVLV